MANKTIQIVDATFKLAAGDYLVVVVPTPGKHYGYQYSCHRAIGAARRQAKRSGGKIYICSNGTQRYEVV